MTDYPNKTNRDKQWQHIREGLVEGDIPRSRIKKYETYFFSGEVVSAAEMTCSIWFLLNPELNLAKWQELLDSGLIYKSNAYKDLQSVERGDSLFEDLQKTFLSYIQDYAFELEDRLWLFQQIYGELHDPQRRFPLKLPGESEYRAFDFDSDYILSGFLLDVVLYVRDDDTDKINWFMFIQPYVMSLIKHCDKAGFNIDGQGLEDEVRELNRYINMILEVAVQDPALLKGEKKEKALFAQEVKALFDQYEGDLGDYPLLIEKHQQAYQKKLEKAEERKRKRQAKAQAGKQAKAKIKKPKEPKN